MARGIAPTRNQKMRTEGADGIGAIVRTTPVGSTAMATLLKGTTGKLTALLLVTWIALNVAHTGVMDPVVF